MIQFVEKDIEDMMFNAPKDSLKHRGLKCFNHTTLLRQVNLGAYGIADLIGFQYEKLDEFRTVSTVTVYELKKDGIGFSAFGQACRYISGLKKYFEIFKEESAPTFYEIVLIGSSIELSSNFVYAASFNDFLSCYTYTFDYHGLLFNKQEMNEYRPSSLSDAGLGILEKRKFEDLFYIKDPNGQLMIQQNSELT